MVIPGNVALRTLAKPVPVWLLPSAPIVRPGDDELRALSELLNGGERVMLFCGAGCAGAHDEVVLDGRAGELIDLTKVNLAR